jgi:hypothetical protein
MNSSHYHLSNFHNYRMRVYQPNVAEVYDKLHEFLKADPYSEEVQRRIEYLIGSYNLKQRAVPENPTSRYWGIYLRKLINSGEESVARDPGHEVKGYFLSAFHQLRMHQFKPDIGIEYADLHNALARDGQDERVMGKLVDLIVNYNLRHGKPPEGYDPPTMQKQADALLRRNREQPFR